MTVPEIVETLLDRPKRDGAAILVGAQRAWDGRSASEIALAIGHAAILMSLSQPFPKRALLAQLELLQHVADGLDDDPISVHAS